LAEQATKSNHRECRTHQTRFQWQCIDCGTIDCNSARSQSPKDLHQLRFEEGKEFLADSGGQKTWTSKLTEKAN
jgi:hypothetical protein